MIHEYPYQNNHELNLDWILSELNKFRETFNSWAETISELQEGLENLDNINSRLDSLETISNQIPTIKKTLDNLINLHDVDIKNVKSLINDLQNQIDNIDISALKIYVDSRDNMLQADINKKFYDNYIVTYELFNGLSDRLIQLAEIVNQLDTKAYNPWYRRIAKESLQTNLNFAYSDLADLVPTASEYAELGLTATEYNKFDLTAHVYSLAGRIKLKMHYVFSPVFGYKQEINNVLTSIIDYIKGTMSADEYTALNMSADEYTALNLDANEYYSYNSEYGLLALGGSGLTASEYSTIHSI